MLRFQNDYSEGAHPNVLRALCDTNLSSTPGSSRRSVIRRLLLRKYSATVIAPCPLS